MDTASPTYIHQVEQWSKCCFYLVTAPENTKSSAVVVVGGWTTSVALPQACRDMFTLLRHQVAQPMGLQTPLSGTAKPRATCSYQGTAGITPALSLHFQLLTQHKTKTQNGHKYPTRWPISCHSWIRVIFDTPDLFISLTGTILTRI